MLAAAISDWEAVPTELDELWCPSIEFASGGAEGNLCLLIEGGARPSQPAFRGERHYLLRFSGVEAVNGYAESLYCFFVRPNEADMPVLGTKIRRAAKSDLLDCAAEIGRSPRMMYAVLGGDMQCEIVANPEFVLRGYESRADALRAAQSERARKTVNLERSQPEAQALLDSLISKERRS